MNNLNDSNGLPIQDQRIKFQQVQAFWQNKVNLQFIPQQTVHSNRNQYTSFVKNPTDVQSSSAHTHSEKSISSTFSTSLEKIQSIAHEFLGEQTHELPEPFDIQETMHSIIESKTIEPDDHVTYEEDFSDRSLSSDSRIESSTDDPPLPEAQIEEKTTNLPESQKDIPTQNLSLSNKEDLKPISKDSVHAPQAPPIPTKVDYIQLDKDIQLLQNGLKILQNPNKKPRYVEKSDTFKSMFALSKILSPIIKGFDERKGTSNSAKQTVAKLLDTIEDIHKANVRFKEAVSPLTKGTNLETALKNIQSSTWGKQVLLNNPDLAIRANFLLKEINPSQPKEDIQFKKIENKEPYNHSELSLIKKLVEHEKALKFGQPSPLTEENKQSIQKLFIKSIDNETALSQLKELHKTEKNDEAKEVLNTLMQVCFRSKDIHQVLSNVKKLEVLMQKTTNEQLITDSEKLTLKELGAIEVWSEMYDNLRILDRLNSKEMDPRLSQFDEACHRGLMMIEQMELKLNKYSNYKSGDFLFTDINKHIDLINRKENFHIKLKKFILKRPLEHVSIIVKNSDKTKDLISHVNIKHEIEKCGIREKAGSSAYRLDTTKLLTTNLTIRHLLGEMFEKKGQTLDSGIQTMYQDTQQNLHLSKKDKLGQIKNDKNRINKSGFAEIFKIMHASRKGLQDFNNLHQEIYGDSEQKRLKMICSETAAITMLAGLIEQDGKLRESLTTFLTEQKGMTSDQIENLLNDTPLFELPIDKTESFSHLNPTRFLDILAHKNCINRLDSHPLLQQVIKKQDLAIGPSEALVNAKVISGFNEQETHLQKMKPIEQTAKIIVEDPFTSQQSAGPVDLSSKWSDLDGGMLQATLKFTQSTTLPGIVKETREEIRSLKETWKKKIESDSSPDRKQIMKTHAEGSLKPVSGGMGGAYLLLNADQSPTFIIKPADEDILSLNNRKGIATPYKDDPNNKTRRTRRDIPLYTTVQTEVLTYQVAKTIGLAHVTPKTEMVILKDNSFHDITDNTTELANNKEEFLNQLGHPDKEKFCSAQEFIKDSQELQEFLEQHAAIKQKNDLTERQFLDNVEKSIDQKDFEACLLLCCITGEQDGNSGNFRLYKKGENEQGKPLYGMQKVDNALCFAEAGGGYINFLAALPNIEHPLSDEARQMILDIPISEVTEQMKAYGKSEQAIQVFKERVALLQDVVQMENINLKHVSDTIKFMKNAKLEEIDGLQKAAIKKATPKVAESLNNQTATIDEESEDETSSSGSMVRNNIEDDDETSSSGSMIRNNVEDDDETSSSGSMIRNNVEEELEINPGKTMKLNLQKAAASMQKKESSETL